MNEPSMEVIGPEAGGPITDSPDLPRTNGFVGMLKRTLAQRSAGPLRAYLLVPAKAPKDFALESLPALAQRLQTDDLGVAKALLAEAEAIFQEPVDRIEGAERRATTLQGAVAVAASVVIAGAGLMLDPDKVSGQGWRIALGAMLLSFVLCLTASAMRALGATSRIFRFHQPGPDRIAERARMGECDALVHRAAELLRAASVADQIGRVKVGLLRSAAWWFRAAILMLAVMAGLILTYTIAANPPTTGSDSTSPTVVGESTTD